QAVSGRPIPGGLRVGPGGLEESEFVMDIEIGSNLYRNTDGTIEIEGVPQITIELRKSVAPIRMSFVIYDETGKVIGKVVDSSLSFNQQRAFEMTRTPTGLLLKQLDKNKVVLKVDLKDGRVVISQGDFITIKGHRLEISQVEWRIDPLRMSGQEHDAKGKPVRIE
ncbi:MAG: hypothetical protein ACREI3_12255, partial [Nitrospirales bacterium]